MSSTTTWHAPTDPDVVASTARAALRAPRDEAAARLLRLALEMQSVAVRDVIAHVVEPGATYASLVERAVAAADGGTGAAADGADGADEETVAAWCSLAAAAGLHRATADDLPAAIALYRHARRLAPVGVWTRKHAFWFAQMLWHGGEQEALSRDAELLRHLAPTNRRFLQADLAGHRHGVGSAPWLARLGETLASHGGPPVALGAQGPTPFDRLSAATTTPAAGGATITVVMPAYRPGPDIRTAVRSVLEQSWEDLELLVVDDASGPEHAPLFAEIAACDPRVRVLTQPVNRGTYAARNRALEEARGEFVTFQDVDDWSHPERLERQVRPLLDDPGLLRTLSVSVRCSSDLVFQYLGYVTMRPNASSHLFRRSALDVVGRFDWVRKSADTEFDRRLEAAFPGRRLHLPEPLAFVRLEPDSLSRGDFRPGWMHPARVEYRASMLHWHASVAVGAESPLVPADVTRRPLSAPRPFLRGVADPDGPLDVAVAADWTAEDGASRAAVEEVSALARDGARVGVVQLRSPRSAAPTRAPLPVSLRRLVADGTVTAVSLEEADEVGTLVVREPDLLEWPSTRPVALRPSRVVVVAQSPPTAGDGSDHRWTARDVDRTARALFGVAPHWWPGAEEARRAVAEVVEPERVVADPHPNLLDVGRWATDRTRFRGEVPVVGWVCDEAALSLPADAETLSSVLPLDGSVDVRLLGGRARLRQLLGAVPPAWLVHEKGEITARELMNQVDFLVCFPDAVTADATRTLDEGLAAGCVAVVDRRFEPTFGDGAVYAAPQDVARVVAALRADPAEYRRLSARGAARAARRTTRSTGALGPWWQGAAPVGAAASV